jgi:hypothetical protein
MKKILRLLNSQGISGFLFILIAMGLLQPTVSVSAQDEVELFIYKYQKSDPYIHYYWCCVYDDSESENLVFFAEEGAKNTLSSAYSRQAQKFLKILFGSAAEENARKELQEYLGVDPDGQWGPGSWDVFIEQLASRPQIDWELKTENIRMKVSNLNSILDHLLPESKQHVSIFLQEEYIDSHLKNPAHRKSLRSAVASARSQRSRDEENKSQAGKLSETIEEKNKEITDLEGQIGSMKELKRQAAVFYLFESRVLWLDLGFLFVGLVMLIIGLVTAKFNSRDSSKPKATLPVEMGNVEDSGMFVDGALDGESSSIDNHLDERINALDDSLKQFLDTKLSLLMTSLERTQEVAQSNQLVLGSLNTFSDNFYAELGPNGKLDFTEMKRGLLEIQSEIGSREDKLSPMDVGRQIVSKTRALVDQLKHFGSEKEQIYRHIQWLESVGRESLLTGISALHSAGHNPAEAGQSEDVLALQKLEISDKTSRSLQSFQGPVAGKLKEVWDDFHNNIWQTTLKRMGVSNVPESLVSVVDYNDFAVGFFLQTRGQVEGDDRDLLVSRCREAYLVHAEESLKKEIEKIINSYSRAGTIPVTEPRIDDTATENEAVAQLTKRLDRLKMSESNSSENSTSLWERSESGLDRLYRLMKITVISIEIGSTPNVRDMSIITEPVQDESLINKVAGISNRGLMRGDVCILQADVTKGIASASSAD